MDSQIRLPIQIIATVACVIVLAIIQLGAADAFELTSRQPWMDEIHTLELVSDPDTSHMLDALADGADFNPPGYYLIARTITQWAGSSEPKVLRTLSLMCVIAGLTAIGLSLQRYARFSVAIAVVAGLWCRGTVVSELALLALVTLFEVLARIEESDMNTPDSRPSRISFSCLRPAHRTW